eukprot:g38004.t1
MGSEGRGLDVVLELATEARNFQLAAEIYQRQLRARQQQQAGGDPEEVRLRRARCLVLAERLSEALQEYQHLSAQGSLRAEHLGELVDFLAGSLRVSQGWGEGEPPGVGLLSCRWCTGTLFEPVTLRCGHTYCKNCLEKERESQRACCKVCKERVPTAGACRINVVLNSFLGKYFPAETRALTLRHEGNSLYKKNKPLAALEKYHQAVALACEFCTLFAGE